MSTPLPQHARVVIVGGGIVGCSVAYHLTKMGWTDVVLLEQGQLSCGTTWHAAGLVGQLRAQESMTKLIRYSTALYAELEADTGLATGWKQCGSLSVARTAERMTQLKRTAAVARAYGVTCDVISPQEAGDLWPVMRTDDLLGAVWLPGDGKANPTDLTQALARGARTRGARIVENTRVTAIHTRQTPGGREVSGLAWRNKDGAEGIINAEIVVNCAGQWAKAVGRLCDVTVPLHSAEHYYIVTERIAGVHPDLPVMRDPDGFIYFKEEVGGLVMGGFEPNAKPWGMNGIPENFEFQLLPDDWDQFEILMENALQRVPALESAQVRQFYNGPESFTPDNNFILGEAPELRHFFVGAGFNSMGIASAGGAGMALAEWIVAGTPTMDLWPVDIRRFARFNGNDTWLHDRVKETLGLHYAMPWPNRELDSARPFRRSPLYPMLRDQGASFGSKMGWERPNFFAPSVAEAKIDYAFGQQNWLPWSGAEHRACREGVALFDMTSFSKFLVKGRDAEEVLQGIVANDVAVPPGTTVYTGMLNERGTYESDFTLTRLAADQYLIVTGSAQTTRDFDYIEKSIPHDRHCTLVDVTGPICGAGGDGSTLARAAAKHLEGGLEQRRIPVRPEPRGGHRLCHRARYAAHLCGRTGLGAVRAGRICGGRLRDAACRRQTDRPPQRGLLRHRFSAYRERLPCLGPRTDAGFKSVRSRPLVRLQAEQENSVPRPRGAAEAARGAAAPAHGRAHGRRRRRSHAVGWRSDLARR